MDTWMYVISALSGHHFAFSSRRANRYPPLAVLHPELGRGCLEYRKERAPVARANAQAHGYNGSKCWMLSICVYTCAEKHP